MFRQAILWLDLYRGSSGVRFGLGGCCRLLRPNCCTTLETALIAALILLATQRDAAGDGRKGVPEQSRSVQQLIDQLGNRSFRVREKATLELTTRPDALPALRQALLSEDLEVQRRAQRIIEATLASQELRKVRHTDRLIDYLLSRKEAIGDEEWRMVLRLAVVIESRAGIVKHGRNNRPPLMTFMECRCTTGANVAEEQLGGRRILAERVSCVDHLVHSVAVCREVAVTHEAGSIIHSVVFANGNVSCRSGIQDSIIVCDGDVVAGSIASSIVIVTGSVTTDPDGNLENNVIVQGEWNPLGLLEFFGPAVIGADVAPVAGKLRVKKVRASGLLANAGVVRGDEIVAVGGLPVRSAQEFRRGLRKDIAGGSAAQLTIRRNDRNLTVKIAPPAE